jgi:hypothetical protein
MVMPWRLTVVVIVIVMMMSISNIGCAVINKNIRSIDILKHIFPHSFEGPEVRHFRCLCIRLGTIK